MSFEKRPQKIQEAMNADDTKTLSAAGRRGAEHTNAVKKRERERIELKEILGEMEKERRKMEDSEMHRAANEHIITPDGEDVSESN